MMHTPLARRLRALRAEAGLTNAQVSKATRMDPNTLSDLERGVVTRPRVGTLKKLADVYGISVDELLLLAEQEQEVAPPLGPRPRGGAPPSTEWVLGASEKAFERWLGKAEPAAIGKVLADLAVAITEIPKARREERRHAWGRTRSLIRELVRRSSEAAA